MVANAAFFYRNERKEVAKNAKGLILVMDVYFL
jgi:hypothetical protein